MNKAIPSILRLSAGAALVLLTGGCVTTIGGPTPLPPDMPSPGDPRPGRPFQAVGTVSLHGVDNCMEARITHDLHQTHGASTYWLSPRSPQDTDLLNRAVRTGAPVRVSGRIRQGLRPDCIWVDVFAVTPL